jgi:membrane-bound lytic murein transglycosylase F
MMSKTTLLLFIVVVFWAGCQKDEHQENGAPTVEVDLEQIKERGKLVAITGYDANSYFIYKGRPMGYEYELLSLLADSLRLKLEIVVARDMDAIFDLLNNGEGDVLAANLTITKERAKKVNFTDFLITTQQVLVQRKPDNWRSMKLHEIDEELIRDPIDLIGKKVHVRRGSSYYARLQNLSDEIGGDIDIVEAPGDIATDELIRKISEGEIEYTVADENIALINQAYYSNIDVATSISFPQRIAWVTRKNSPQLLAAVNKWIRKMKSETDYYVIYNKYYRNTRGFRRRVKSEFFSHTGGKISEYDEFLKERADSLNWDWRILASQVYQESQFEPGATSWAGAVGLMQLLPETAKQFGAKDSHDPFENIKAGTNYLKWLDDYWEEIEDEGERLKFVLASYNVGQGHVQDARRLANKFDRDENVWRGNVAYYMLQLSKEKFYNDEVVQFGYCRGEEPRDYVREIFERYEHYRQFVD